jgi:hypothetical protein
MKAAERPREAEEVVVERFREVEEVVEVVVTMVKKEVVLGCPFLMVVDFLGLVWMAEVHH